jgi:DUF4097 and DUF4098 domain-containing protein YvlB
MRRAAILLLTLSATGYAADYKDVNKTVPLSANGSVEIETQKGSIRVSTWDRHEVEIQARIEAEPGTVMNRRLFDTTDVKIDSTEGSVRIKTNYFDFNWCCSSDTGSYPDVRYTIKLPKTAALTVHDHRSDTEISGLQGALNLSTHRGTARVHALSGALHLDTHRGDIHVEFASFTANSSITTHRGTIDLSMPKTSRFGLETRLGRHGSIDTDFTVMTHTIGRRGESIQGAVNGGGPTLRIETERGEVRLHGR